MLIYLLTVFLPTQLGYHFWPNWAYIFGIRVDYLSPIIFLTDVMAWLLIVSNFKKIKINLTKIFPFLVFIILNIVLAREIYVAAYKWLKIAEVLLLALIIIKNVKAKVERIKVLNILFVASFIFSLIGLFQVLLGHTIGGLFYFLGERSFSKFTPGISTANILGHTVLLPYSTFSHPNSLAGFLGVALLIYWLYLPKSVINKIFAGFISLVFLLTGSLGAFTALVVAVCFKQFKRFSMNLLLAVLLIGSMILPFIKNSVNYPQNIFLRLSLSESALKVFVNNPVFGVGLGNFIPSSISVSYPTSGVWFLQPVHNLFLLMLSEIGVVGLIFVVYFLTRIRSAKLQVLITFILISGLFDHYWLTLQQNMLLLGFVFGLLL